MKRLLVLLSIFALLAVAGWKMYASRSQNMAAAVRISTADVSRAPLVITLPLNGTLESAQETPVRGDIAGTLVDICEDNSPVQPGDFIFQLDTEELYSQREDLVRALTDAQEELDSTQADGQTRITQAESDVLAAREALQLAETTAQGEREKMTAEVEFTAGELARAERELKRAQRLAKLNYIPGTKLRQAEKAYRKKEFELEQKYSEQADLMRSTAEQVQAAETDLQLALHELETAKADALADTESDIISVAESQRRLDEIDQKIEQCTVTSPAEGLAVIQTNSSNWPERRPYRLGDQVQSGAAPVTIYNLNKMQVRCQIGEMDILRVKAGQEVRLVSLNGDQGYGGRVSQVEELAKEANVWEGGTPGKKVFGLLVTLDKTDPARLRPGMTVDLEIVLQRIPETTTVPLRAVFDEGEQSVAYIARDGGFSKQVVTTGARNDLFVEIKSGLNIGETVALDRPSVLIK